MREVGGCNVRYIGMTCSSHKCPDDNSSLESKKFGYRIALSPKERREKTG